MNQNNIKENGRFCQFCRGVVEDQEELVLGYHKECRMLFITGLVTDDNSLTITDENTEFTLKELELFQNSTRLKFLLFKDCHKFDVLENLSLNNLESLEIKKSSILSLRTTHLPKLKSLIITDSAIESVNVNDFPELECFKLSKGLFTECSNLCLSHLKELRLNSMPSLTKVQNLDLPNLNQLDLLGCNIKNFSNNNLPTLKELDLWIALDLKNLNNEIYIDNEENIVKKILIDLFKNNNLTQLEILKVFFTKPSSFNSIILPQVRELDLDLSMISEFKKNSFQRLESLNLTSSYSLEVFDSVHSPNLKVLNMSYTSKLKKLVNLNFPRLEELNLRKSSITKIKNLYCPNLEVLNLSDSLDLELIEDLYCPKIKSLILSNSGLIRITNNLNLENKFFIRVLNQYEGLKVLVIKHYSLVKKFEHLNLQNIEELDLEESSISSFKNNQLPNLKRLSLNNTPELEEFALDDYNTIEFLVITGTKLLSFSNYKMNSLQELYLNANFFRADEYHSEEKYTVISGLDMPVLTILDLSDSYFNNFENNNLPSLKILIFDFSWYLEKLESLNLPNLEELSAYKAYGLVSFKHNNLPKIKRLILRKAILIELNDNNYPELEELNVNVTAIEEFKNNIFPKLKELYFNRCNRLKILIGSDLSSLEVLDTGDTILSEFRDNKLPTLKKFYLPPKDEIKNLTGLEFNEFKMYIKNNNEINENCEIIPFDEHVF